MADDGTSNDAQNQNDQQDQGSGAGSAGDQGQQDRTFTQADVDRIVQERVARVKSDPPTDYADLQAKAKKLEEIENANATELEKAQKRAEDAEKVAAAATATAKATALRASIIAEAAKPDRKIADIEAAFGFLTGIDNELVELDADGNPTDIAKAVDSLLERRPILVAQNGGARAGGADQGARGNGTGPAQVTRDELKDMSPEEIRKATDEGRMQLIATGAA